MVSQWTFAQVKAQATHPSPSVQLIDVRELKEHTMTAKHAPIPSSACIPMSTFDPSLVQVPDKQELVFYCEAGVRAKQAADRMEASGCKLSISYYPGSHKEWREKAQ